MAAYTSDKDGVVALTDENGRLLFDKNTGVSVAGWSNHPLIKSKFKNVTESSGKAQTKEG